MKNNPEEVVVTPNWGESKPNCNCNTGSWFKCLGCALGGSRCTWRMRGCGAGGWYSCNGLCPLS